MKNFIKNVIVWLLLISMSFGTISVKAEEKTEEEATSVELFSPSGLLMEAETGTVIFEKDKDSRRSPASVTKIMTLILIFDEIKNGKLTMDELVTTSANAKSMGGSQVFLEEGEQQTVETMIKCIVIASGNDASVAMAEHISGNETAFVEKMNKRAQELEMKNTHFVDCCGLTDSDDHYTSAYDIALMSRELILNYPEILKYSSIWMDTIIHETQKGREEFGLTNTNRMVRNYDGCVGLKTGSTNKAKFCLSAVAKRDGITLISVVMGAPDYKARIQDASAMLNYGFAKCSYYTDKNPPKLSFIPVKKGKEDQVELKYGETFQYLDFSGRSITDIKKELKLETELLAPVKEGDQAGTLIYYRDGKEIGEIPVLCKKNVERRSYLDCMNKLLEKWCM